MKRAPVRWSSYLSDAIGYAEAGFYFSEGGCWGMALALHNALGGDLKVSLRRGGTHAWVEADGWAYDDEGASASGQHALQGETVSVSELFELAAESGVGRDSVLSDAEWASSIILAAQELADEDVRPNRRPDRRG